MYHLVVFIEKLTHKHNKVGIRGCGTLNSGSNIQTSTTATATATATATTVTTTVVVLVLVVVMCEMIYTSFYQHIVQFGC